MPHNASDASTVIVVARSDRLASTATAPAAATDVLSTMRRLAPQTPIILMTGSVSVDVLDQARQLGATAIVHTPFDMAAVAPLIEQVLTQG